MSVPRPLSRPGALVPLALALLAACGGDDGPTGPGAPTVFDKTAGDGISGVVAQQVSAAPTLKVTDDRGRPVPGVVVSFASSAGTLGATQDTTDAAGLATAGSWRLGPVAGAQTVTATSVDVAGATATFTVTASPAPASQIVFQSSPPANTRTNTPFTGPVLALLDQFGNQTTSTATVTLSVTGTAGALSGQTAIPAVAGRATFGALEFTTGGAAVRLVASAPGIADALSTPVLVNSSGPASLVRVSPDAQLGAAGTAAFLPPQVRVLDNAGVPIPGVTVTFAATAGGGSFASATATTDIGGLATSRWTFGPAAGSNTARVTVDALAADFAATTLAASPFHIELRYVNIPTPRQQQAFEAAWLKWRGAITGELQDIGSANPIPNVCGTGQTFSGIVDDLVIYVNLRPIDGPNAVLGSAGPCAVRPNQSGVLQPFLPALGVMTFDTADLPSLESAGQLDQVILHEMGHVLGIGTVWTDLGLLIGANSDTSSFNGTGAKSAWTTLGGASGSRVPVENCVGLSQPCGAGTRDGHWRETTFRNELMTGYLNGGVANPLSALTLNSLQDLGYTVNLGAAEAYALPTAASTGSVRGALLAQGSLRALVEGPQSWDRVVFDGRGGWRRLPPRQ